MRPPRLAPSPNHDARPAGVPIDTLVLHYTGMRSAAEAIDRLRNSAAAVSAHYVIEEDGLVWQLVPEARRAWHAGVSQWRGRTGLNARSIGIELVNPGHEHGYRAFPALQMAALCELCLGILGRHPIAARDVVGHSDIAPDRKQDPGELFDWQGLAAQGVGIWPKGTPAGPPDGAPASLRKIGYRTDLPLPILVQAFQRHWMPERCDGVADAAVTRRIAEIRTAMGE